MTVCISKIRGISAPYTVAIKTQRTNSSQSLVETTETSNAGTTHLGRRARKELTTVTGTKESAVLELTNCANLARALGIGAVFLNLLEEAGMDLGKELSKCRPDNLHVKLAKETVASHYAKRSLTPVKCIDWAEQTKSPPKLLM